MMEAEKRIIREGLKEEEIDFPYNWLRLSRLQSGLTMCDIQRLTKVSQSRISRCERGRHNLSSEELRKITQVIDDKKKRDYNEELLEIIMAGLYSCRPGEIRIPLPSDEIKKKPGEFHKYCVGIINIYGYNKHDGLFVTVGDERFLFYRPGRRDILFKRFYWKNGWWNKQREILLRKFK